MSQLSADEPCDAHVAAVSVVAADRSVGVEVERPCDWCRARSTGPPSRQEGLVCMGEADRPLASTQRRLTDWLMPQRVTGADVIVRRDQHLAAICAERRRAVVGQSRCLGTPRSAALTRSRPWPRPRVVPLGGAAWNWQTRRRAVDGDVRRRRCRGNCGGRRGVSHYTIYVIPALGPVVVASRGGRDLRLIHVDRRSCAPAATAHRRVEQVATRRGGRGRTRPVSVVACAPRGDAGDGRLVGRRRHRRCGVTRARGGRGGRGRRRVDG